MFNSQNVTAVFILNTDSTKKPIGSGILNFAGVQTQYSVYSSSFNPYGIMVTFPSKARYQDGKPVLNAYGKTTFDNLVSIVDPDVLNLANEAVLAAMANKGVYLEESAQKAKEAGATITKVIPTPISNKDTFTPPSNNTNTANDKSKLEAATKQVIKDSVQLPKDSVNNKSIPSSSTAESLASTHIKKGIPF